MFRNVWSFGAVALLTGAALLAAPAVGYAQRGGGHGGGGGFHGASIHSGGFRTGGYHAGGVYGGSRYGGSRYSGYGYNHYRSYYGGYGYIPYYSYYGGYGNYPYYNNYYGGSYPSYDSSYPYYGDATPYTYTAPATSGYQSGYYTPTPTAASDNTASVTVNVPADAQVWFDDKATTSTGGVRQYATPPLTPGKGYTYEVRARWNDNGKEVTQTQQVEVRAGANVRVTFPAPEKP